jgi:LmbE family N-acetylglucosaminyl deacetylase
MNTVKNHIDQPTPPGPSSTRTIEYTTVGNTLPAITRPLPRRLLGVWAHPDDEAYLSAGLMARVSANGGHVTVVTATRGEKGTSDPADYDQDHFGALREYELRHSLATLGVDDVRFLGLRDGECDVADDESTIASIADVIAEVRPDVVVTFGPDGMTGHADHRAISRWTTEANRRVEIGELLYATVTHDWAAHHQRMNQELGVYADRPDGRPASVGRRAVALECALGDAELDLKRRALAAHGSQTAALADMIGEATYRTWWKEERFRRPTTAEMAGCPVPDWVRTTGQLVGAPA